MTKEMNQYFALILENQRIMMENNFFNRNDIYDLKSMEGAIDQTKLGIIELTKENKPKKVNDNPFINEIFNCWNDKKDWQKHKSISLFVTPIKKAINSGFSTVEICAAITNYIIVVESDDFFFNYKWDLRHFLERGLLKFVESAEPLNNFRGRNGIKENKKPIISDEEFQEFTGNFSQR